MLKTIKLIFIGSLLALNSFSKGSDHLAKMFVGCHETRKVLHATCALLQHSQACYFCDQRHWQILYTKDYCLVRGLDLRGNCPLCDLVLLEPVVLYRRRPE